ncbi:hypothetical protein TSUD_160060 [Trifolium subterraneum]|uniref:Uncharacterized protein n=1 Tax=Trifolium subterraneum TaxID=3900 RepID=A0A2Z6M7K6_TRISU|nr:hypothetical protein TSUD_160060 [Trifolium subterraneum]
MVRCGGGASPRVNDGVRNDWVFNNVEGDVEDAVVSIQLISWQWYLNRVATGSCLLHEWVWNPGDYMLQ